ncbi:hypothetical protein GCM10020255_047340 [Rhodococcus baikonurensis]
MSVTIAYNGNPEPIRSLWGEVGWEELDEGILVASQPNGAASWFPCDDHPISKASYRISITTDSPFYALANGKLIRKQTRASQTTWVYEQTEPMATYLATIQIGQYEHRQVSAARCRSSPFTRRGYAQRSTSISVVSHKCWKSSENCSARILLPTTRLSSPTTSSKSPSKRRALDLRSQPLHR